MPMADTHEHLAKEAEYIENGPDALADVFGMYILGELVSAGAPRKAVERLKDGRDPDVEGRWNGIKEAWERCRYTGYGEAARLVARLVYGIDEITLPAILAAGDRNAQLRRPGERLRLLKEVANLEYVQVDDFLWACLPDPSGPEFFFYDLSWANFCNGQIDFPTLFDETQVEVRDLATLRQAMAALFANYGDCAIAVKAQHAYERTLAWRERADSEAEPVLQKLLRGDAISDAERLCIGDWGWARGVELATEHNLPFKLHTGYLAGNDSLTDVDRTRPGHLGPLLMRYGDARFVLMHIAYPYEGEVAAVAKHFPNVRVDMCWAWSIDPFSAANFVRRMIHTVPIHKLFAFGGDTFWPAGSVAYATQARQWLTRALRAEVDEGFLTEAEAIRLATRLMRENQAACFDLDGTRAAIRERSAAVPAGGLD
jgi:predicted TIM-barrel fold metal-dependent hydrolase